MRNFFAITVILGFFVLVQARNLTQQSKYGPLKAPNCGTIRSRSRRVVGGTDAQLGAFPWMASIGYKKDDMDLSQWICAGSIISARHVLTDVVCVHTKKYQYVVRVGDLNLDETVADGASSMDVGVEEISKHPEFSERDVKNDIAVMRLNRDLQFTEFIKPICLPALENVLGTNYEGTKAIIAGWGVSNFEEKLRSSRLQTAEIQLLNTSLCMKIYNKIIKGSNSVIQNNIVCAGHLPGGKDTCYGDSGAPLMIEQDGSYYSIGIVSYGEGCASPGIPAIYTKVSPYLKWIISKLN